MTLWVEESTCSCCSVGYEPSAVYSFSWFICFLKINVFFFFFFSNKKIFEGTLCLVISSHVQQICEDEGTIMPSLLLDTVFDLTA